jgi:hypothetical protein
LSGLVTRTVARVRLTDMVADDDLVCPPPVPACEIKGHPPALPSQLGPNQRWTGVVSKRSAPTDLGEREFLRGDWRVPFEAHDAEAHPATSTETRRNDNLP